MLVVFAIMAVLDGRHNHSITVEGVVKIRLEVRTSAFEEGAVLAMDSIDVIVLTNAVEW